MLKEYIIVMDEDNQTIPVDIVDEWDELITFRRKQREIDLGIPQEYWEIR